MPRHRYTVVTHCDEDGGPGLHWKFAASLAAAEQSVSNYLYAQGRDCCIIVITLPGWVGAAD